MDVRLWFDPVCPFCWMTSKWLRLAATQRDLAIEWRFISLRLLNAGVDYDAQFPPEYEAGHTAGLRMLRVAARVRKEHGTEALDRHGLETNLEAHARQAYAPARGATARVTTQRCLPILRSRTKPSCS